MSSVPTLFWDASGLAKYYAEEIGNDTTETLFHQLPVPKMLTTLWGYTETFSLLQRKRNDNRLSNKLFAEAVSRLRTDMIDLPQFHLLTVTNTDLMGSVNFIQRHNINATDAALLATLLRYSRISSEACVLVAADKRMLRAARAEGLPIVDPEAMPPGDVPAFLAAF